MEVPRDIFGGKGPSNADIEREAQRELDRLTRATRPNMGPVGGAVPGGMGGAAPPSFGPQSPLEAMAQNLGQRKKVRKKKSGLAAGEDKKSWGNDGFAPSSISGSVGSALDFGGGVAPGMMRKAPPPDAQPLRRKATADDYDDDDFPDDDVGVTEIALRDHAERFGKNLEDMVIRSDPTTAEAMREAAMQKYMQRAAAPESSGGFTPPARLNLRRRGPLRRVEDVEPDEPEPEAEELEDEPPEQELEELEHQLEAEQARDTVTPPLGLMVDERARLAERRAELAEERARLAEARAAEAEFQLTVAAELFADYERRLHDLEADADADAKAETEEVEEVDEPEEPDLSDDLEERPAPPPPSVKKGAAKRAPAAKKTAAKRAPAKKKAAAKSAPAAKKVARKRTPPPRTEPEEAHAKATRKRTPPPPAAAAEEDDAPRLGGVLGRRLAAKKTAAKASKRA